jgi:hypothetical protein
MVVQEQEMAPHSNLRFTRYLRKQHIIDTYVILVYPLDGKNMKVALHVISISISDGNSILAYGKAKSN